MPKFDLRQKERRLLNQEELRGIRRRRNKRASSIKQKLPKLRRKSSLKSVPKKAEEEKFQTLEFLFYCRINRD